MHTETRDNGRAEDVPERAMTEPLDLQKLACDVATYISLSSSPDEPVESILAALHQARDARTAEVVAWLRAEADLLDAESLDDEVDAAPVAQCKREAAVLRNLADALEGDAKERPND